MYLISRLGLLAMSLAVASAPAWVRAQDPGNGPGAEDSGGPPDVGPIVAPPPGIEAIEVMGESLDATNVQDEAQAITAFDTGELDRLQIGNVDRLALNVPGLHVGQQGQNAIITLRGVGTENASITGEPGVAFHVDGIYYGSPAAARTAFFDISAIEVKRGPQGLVGGKNSTSGAIHVNTNDPSSDYEFRADYTMGNYDRRRGRGVVNIPVGESLAGRFALFFEERDGYLERRSVVPNFSPNNLPDDTSNRTILDLNDSQDPFDLDNFGLRGKLRFTPTDSVDFVLSYDYFKEGGNGPQADIVPLNERPCQPQIGVPIPPGATTRMGGVGGCRVVARSGVPGNTLGSVFYPVTLDTDPRKSYADFGSSQDDRYWGWGGKLNWEVPSLPALGETNLKLLGGFRENELDFAWDFDGSDQEIFNLFQNTRTREYTSELQWSGGDRLSWQTSLFFQRQTGDSRTLSTQSEQIPDPTVTKLPDLRSIAAYLNTIGFDSTQSTQNKSYGASIHGTYQFSDSLSLGVGGRFNKDHKTTFLAVRRNLDGITYEACRPRPDAREYGQRPVPVAPSAVGFAETLPSRCGLTFRGTSWGSRLEWKPRDEYLLYAGIDRGYKSGGFASGGIGTYLPEKIWAYTLGAKTEFFDSILQFNIEGFVYNYQDMQLTLIDATKLRTENSDARMYGWEVEMRAEPLEGLRLQGLVAYLHTETQDYFSIDPAHLGVEYVQRKIGNRTEVTVGDRARLTARDKFERRGIPWTQIAPIENCQTSHTAINPFTGLNQRFAPRRCSQFGQKDGLDDYSGNQLSRSPELKWNISAEYDFHLGRFGKLMPSVQYAWQDDAYYRAFNRDFDLQKAYHETNLGLAWISPEERWDVRAFINNIENAAIKQNILIGPSTFGSIPLAWYGEPRFYGVQIGFKY